jgi:hypothetical protein
VGGGLSQVAAFGAVLYAFSVISCGSAAQSGVGSRAPESNGDCPRLDSQLYQLAQSRDQQGFASGAGLDLTALGVRTHVELATGNDLPVGHRVTIEARYANFVQVRVPPAELCALARESAVLSVRPPTIVPDGGKP